MKSLKPKLLAATILVGASSPAFAQISFPNVQIDGVGASTPGDINTKVMNCIGANLALGKNDGTTSTVVAADYLPTTPSSTNPSLTCSTTENIYNGTGTFTGTYISTGSGFGRKQWENFTNNFDGSDTNKVPPAAPFGVKPNYQYALSETPINTADITDYNADDAELGASTGPFATVDVDVSALANAGPAIQIPLYVVPIAFAYNGQYGIAADGTTPMLFNNKYAATINGVQAGGIHMTRDTYCNIWNGNITNWNNAAFKTSNNNTTLQDTTNDTAARWASEGAPIRLIGRADKSGATDVFTRALAAQCSATPANKFAKAAESLPFNSAGTIDLRNIRGDTNYKPGVASTSFAGTVQSLSGYAFDSTGVSCYLGTAAAAGSAPGVMPVVAGNASGGVCTNVATFGTLVTAGTGVLDTAGKFANADGSGNVLKAIAANTGTALVTLTSGVQIDGKLGYIGADFVAGSTGRTLFAAALQVNGTGTVFATPSSANATAAFGTTILPPQTIAASGAYNTTDSRIIPVDLTDAGQGTKTPDRAVPQDWVNVLYASGATLATPAKGYPVVGTSNLLTYTCFSTQAKVHGIANFVQYLTGKITKKNAVGPVSQTGTGTGTINLSANTFVGTAAATLGILAKANIATVPAAWRAAYVETFFKKSTQASPAGSTLGARNLWIQSAQATTATGTGATSLTTIDATPNPKCSGVPGA